MRNAVKLFIVGALIAAPGTSIAGERFDGKWFTELTCPPKGESEGYTWRFPSVIENSSFRGQHGPAGQPGYFVIEGKINEDGNARLSVNGIDASRKSARPRKGDNYSYEIKAQFKEAAGSGTGRACTFAFMKQDAALSPSE